MNNLPFDRWTFKFHNPEHEELFENFTDKVRLAVFKIIVCFLGILGFIFFIQFIVQQESYILFIVFSINQVLMIFLYFIGNKITRLLKYVNLLIYIFIFVLACCVVLSGFRINHFLYGYICSCVSLPAIQYCNYRIKMSIIMFLPAIYLLLFNAYTLYNITFVILIFSSQAVFTAQLYFNEYFLRLSFSFYQITLKQKEILEEYVTNPFLAISFDKRTQQFVPEFTNYEFQKQFKDLDANYLKEFLRMTKIESNSSVNQSADLFLRKQEKKSSTLEELCFFLINQKDQLKTQSCGNILNSSQHYRNVSIEIKKVFLTAPILMIHIKNEKTSQIQEQCEQKIKYYKNLINSFAIQVIEQSENLQKKSKPGSFGQSLSFEQSQSRYLLILNKIKNFWVIVNNGIIKLQQFKVQNINLQIYLNNIVNYFENLGKLYCISFKIHNFTNETLQIKNSVEMLSQILINLLELSLKYSKQQRTITIEVKQNTSVNSQQYSQQNLISDIPSEEELCYQNLITFKIQFFSDKNIELKPKRQISLNPKNLEDYQYTNEEQLDTIWPVCCFVLSKIGPYSEIQTRKVPLQTEFQETIFYYQIIFQIYANYSQQDQSFINHIKEQD